jgi:hypothetical protein
MTAPTVHPGSAASGLRIALLLLPLSCALPSPAAAQSAQGFAEIRGGLQFGVDGHPWTLLERIRPTLEVPLGQRVRIVATVEGALTQGRDLQAEFQRAIDESDFGPLLDLASCEWPDPPASAFLRADSVDDVLSVDRLYVDFYLPGLDLRVGRQSIQWGSAAFLNPSDPFPELLLAEPWRARRGVDAIRANVGLGSAADFTAVIATNRQFDAARLAGRLRGRPFGTDLALVGAFRSDGGTSGKGDGLVGVDLRGTLGVGFWLEAALHVDEPAWGELALGLDYSFPVLETLVLMAQYYRNGAGTKRPLEESSPLSSGGGGALSSGIELPACTAELPPLLAEQAAASGGDGDDSPLAALLGGGGGDDEGKRAGRDPFAPVLRGRDYLLLAATLRIIPELSIQLSALQNLGDGSGLFLPSLQLSPLGWLDIGVQAQLPYAFRKGGGELKPADEDLLLEADLGFLGTRSADLSGLLPEATVTLWTRASF